MRFVAAVVAFGSAAFAFRPVVAQTTPTPTPQTPRPAVHVIATGGTISNTGGARLTGEELVKSLPGIDNVATVSVEQFSNVASGSITMTHWRNLATRINELFKTRPDLTGIVVTHGTDTLEETAFFLDLAVGSCKPVIVTGAMRQATAIGADGPANLFDAIVAAASAKSTQRGTMVLLNDQLFTARDVTKMSTTQPDAFAAPQRGVLGAVTGNQPSYFREADRKSCDTPAFDVPPTGEFPRVDIVYTYIGADSVPIRAMVDAGAKGLVVAGAGNGASVATQGPGLRYARDKGVYVLSGSRTGAGIIGGGTAGDLTVQKSRILLMLALTKTSDSREIGEILRKYSGIY
jgi:L-asparaginase